MAVVSRSGTAIAGMVYNLTCTVTKVDGLINSPTASWTTGTGMMPVSNGNNITVATSSDVLSAVSTLTFDPLRTSHNGAYMCVGSLDSPALQMPLTAAVEEELSVQSKFKSLVNNYNLSVLPPSLLQFPLLTSLSLFLMVHCMLVKKLPFFLLAPSLSTLLLILVLQSLTLTSHG